MVKAEPSKSLNGKLIYGFMLYGLLDIIVVNDTAQF